MKNKIVRLCGVLLILYLVSPLAAFCPEQSVQSTQSNQTIQTTEPTENEDEVDLIEPIIS